MLKLAIKSFGLPLLAFGAVIAYSLAGAPAYAQSATPWDGTAIVNPNAGSAGDPNCEDSRIQSYVAGQGLVWHPLVMCHDNGDGD